MLKTAATVDNRRTYRSLLIKHVDESAGSTHKGNDEHYHGDEEGLPLVLHGIVLIPGWHLFLWWQVSVLMQGNVPPAGERQLGEC